MINKYLNHNLVQGGNSRLTMTRYPTRVTFFMSPPEIEPSISHVQDECLGHCAVTFI